MAPCSLLSTLAVVFGPRASGLAFSTAAAPTTGQRSIHKGAIDHGTSPSGMGGCGAGNSQRGHKDTATQLQQACAGGQKHGLHGRNRIEELMNPINSRSAQRI